MSELRDPYTAGHQRHVAELSVAIALELGEPRRVVKMIGQAAEVHDIGKMSIPAEILTRPGKLNRCDRVIFSEFTHAALLTELFGSTNAGLPFRVSSPAAE